MPKLIHVRYGVSWRIAVEIQVVVDVAQGIQTEDENPNRNGQDMTQKFAGNQGMNEEGQHHVADVFRKFEDIEVVEVLTEFKVEIALECLVQYPAHHHHIHKHKAKDHQGQKLGPINHRVGDGQGAKDLVVIHCAFSVHDFPCHKDDQNKDQNDVGEVFDFQHIIGHG